MASGTDPEDNRPTTTPPGVERPAEHRTFLIADIRGYTRYTDEHGDEAAAALAARFAGLVRDAVEARDGVLLELRGDEALTIFASARQAVRAAVELQQRIATEGLPRGVGVGLDTGEAVPVEGGYRGNALNVAARLCSQARAHEVLASETVVHLAARIEGIRYGNPRTMRVKGLGQPVRVVTVEADSGLRPRRAAIRRSATAATMGRPAIGLAAVLGVVIVAAAVWASAVPGLGPGTTPMPSSSPAAVGSPVRASAGSSPAATSSPSRLPPSPVSSYKGGLSRSAVMPGPGPADEFEKQPTVGWQFPATAAMGASPSVVNDQVYVGDMAGMLHVLDFATGTEAWSFDAGAPIRTTPTVVEGSVYLTTDDGRFQAIDLASHQRRWEVAGAASTAIPTVVRDEAYVGLASGRFQALSAADGQELWHVDLDGDAALNAVSLDIAFVSSAKTDRLYAIDLKTHGIRWSASTGAQGVLTPAVHDGTVYVVATDAAGKNSHVTAFAARTGAEQWRWASPDHSSLSTLVVTSSFVYTTSDSPGGTTLWAIERFSGELAWLKQLKIGPIQPSMVRDHMYLATAAGSVRAIEAIDGDGLETWDLTPGGPAVGAPVVTGGLVLVATAPGGSDPGSLWAIGSGDGAIPSANPDAWAWVADLVAADDQPALYLNVAVDSKGNVYAADRFFNRVVIWDKAGKDQIWGRFGTGKGEFDFGGVTPGDQSQSVAIAADGRIAVGDGGNHRVQIFDSKRKFIRAIGREGEAPGQFINPCCVAFDPEGRLYVADPGRNDIQVFDKAGKFVRIIGGPGSGNVQFDRLGVPYIDPATGLLWIPDFANRRVEVVGPDGSFIATYGDGANDNPTLAEVNGVALDAAGRMFVVDTDNFVWVLDSGGKLITRLGPTIPGHGSVGPAFIVLTADGKLYLPDAQVGSNRVVVMQLKPPLWPPP